MFCAINLKPRSLKTKEKGWVVLRRRLRAQLALLSWSSAMNFERLRRSKGIQGKGQTAGLTAEDWGMAGRREAEANS